MSDITLNTISTLDRLSSINDNFDTNATTTGSASFLSTADGLKAGFSFTVSGCYRIGAA